jgi:hypothetical protein
VVKSVRIKGTLSCPDGAVVPITSARVLEAIRERDRDIARLEGRMATMRGELDSVTVQLRTSNVALERLHGCGWVRLGRWLRLVR